MTIRQHGRAERRRSYRLSRVHRKFRHASSGDFKPAYTCRQPSFEKRRRRVSANLATSSATTASATTVSKTATTATKAASTTSVASEATATPTVSAAPTTPRQFFANFRCSGVFLVEDIEHRQIHIRDFFFMESDFANALQCHQKVYLSSTHWFLRMRRPPTPRTSRRPPIAARLVSHVFA